VRGAAEVVPPVLPPADSPTPADHAGSLRAALSPAIGRIATRRGGKRERHPQRVARGLDAEFPHFGEARVLILAAKREPQNGPPSIKSPTRTKYATTPQIRP
jgi:hypothetical protein